MHHTYMQQNNLKQPVAIGATDLTSTETPTKPLKIPETLNNRNVSPMDKNTGYMERVKIQDFNERHKSPNERKKT